MERPVIILIIIIALVWGVRKAMRKSPDYLKNPILGLASLLIGGLALECMFCFIPKTSNYGKTLATEVWKDYYWKLNSGGFRDQDISKKNNKKRKLVFIGDSFTAGQGIKDPRERFSDIIGSVLKDSFEFYNVGISGSNTEGKAAVLYSLQFKPDIVIYQYFIDDIVDTRVRLDSVLPHTDPYKGTPPGVVFFIENSYLINYLYWMFPHFVLSDYTSYLRECYSIPSVTKEHEKELSQIISYTKANNIRLVFLDIPIPSLYQYSDESTKRIESLVRDSSVTCINITASIDTLPLKDITVNSTDFHLNEKGNRIVAAKLLEKVFGIKTFR